MLNYVVIIIKKKFIDQNFWFVFKHTDTLIFPQLQRSLALYQGLNFINALKNERKKICLGEGI